MANRDGASADQACFGTALTFDRLNWEGTLRSDKPADPSSINFCARWIKMCNCVNQPNLRKVGELFGRAGALYLLMTVPPAHVWLKILYFYFLTFLINVFSHDSQQRQMRGAFRSIYKFKCSICSLCSRLSLLDNAYSLTRTWGFKFCTYIFLIHKFFSTLFTIF